MIDGALAAKVGFPPSLWLDIFPMQVLRQLGSSSRNIRILDWGKVPDINAKVY